MQLRQDFINIWNHKLLAFMIIALAIAPSVFLEKETMLNWMMIGVISLSPLYLLYYNKPTTDENKYWLFIVLFICFTVSFHLATIRWTTIIFSITFLMYYISFMRAVRCEHPNFSFFISVTKLLLLAYWIVLMIQQACVLLGLPIFNVSAYDPAEPWKLNSLMSEPSHSARIIPILMYVYISIKEVVEGEKTLKTSYQSDKIVWFAFLYSSITMFSATAYVFMLIVFAKFLNRRTIIRSLLVCFIGALIISYFGANKTLQRTIDVVEATITLDENKIIEADGSGSYRIVPFFRGANAVGFTTIEDYIGHGIDADMRDIEPLPGTTTGCAGPFVIWYNYGLILQVIYWLITFNICYIRKNKASILIWLLCVFNYGGMNNQIVWLSITLLYSYKYCLYQQLKFRKSFLRNY